MTLFDGSKCCGDAMIAMGHVDVQYLALIFNLLLENEWRRWYLMMNSRQHLMKVFHPNLMHLATAHKAVPTHVLALAHAIGTV